MKSFKSIVGYAVIFCMSSQILFSGLSNVGVGQASKLAGQVGNQAISNLGNTDFTQLNFLQDSGKSGQNTSQISNIVSSKAIAKTQNEIMKSISPEAIARISIPYPDWMKPQLKPKLIEAISQNSPEQVVITQQSRERKISELEKELEELRTAEDQQTYNDQSAAYENEGGNIQGPERSNIQKAAQKTFEHFEQTGFKDFRTSDRGIPNKNLSEYIKKSREEVMHGPLISKQMKDELLQEYLANQKYLAEQQQAREMADYNSQLAGYENEGGNIEGSVRFSKEIGPSVLVQLKKAFQEALEYARSKVSTSIEFQMPIKFGKPTIVSAHPIEAQKFLDLQLFKILRNKTINSTNFLQFMTALAAMFGFYKLLDFVNNLYENNTVLMWAVEADNENAVQFLLHFGADIHKQNSDGDTATIIAAKFGNEKIFKLLIDTIKEKYADDPEMQKKELDKLLNTKNKEGRTAFLETIEYGNFIGEDEWQDPKEDERIAILELCLDNGANISVRDNDGNNVLFLLANKMNTVPNDKDSKKLRELFEFFTKKNPSMVQVVNRKGHNLLMQAVEDNNLYLFDYLKDTVEDITLQDSEGNDILFLALAPIKPEVIKNPIRDKNKTESASNPKFIMVDIFQNKNRLSIVEAVVELLEKKLPKAVQGDAENVLTMQKFLEIRNGNGLDILSYALKYNPNFSIIKLLVDKGARVRQIQLKDAISEKNIRLVNLFLEKSQLSPTFQDLGLAFTSEDITLLKTLLDSKNLKPNIKNEFIKNALYTSLQKQKTHLFDMLLPMADSFTRQSIIKSVGNTGNIAIINDFLNSPKTTDEMRQEMLENAVKEKASEQTIQTILNNPSSQKAYENQYFRSLILREAIKKVKTGEMNSLLGKADNTVVTQDDVMKDPVLVSLIVKFAPTYESKWGTWASDKWASLVGKTTSAQDFDSKKKAFQQEIQRIIVDENQDRKFKKTKKILPVTIKSGWEKMFENAMNQAS